MGLLPLTQSALYIILRLSYHDYEGVALHKDERERLQADPGETSIMLLRNHGTLALGCKPAEAWRGIYGLVKACSAQVAALAGGRDTVLIAPEPAQDEARRQFADQSGTDIAQDTRKTHDQLVWEAVLRKVQRSLTGLTPDPDTRRHTQKPVVGHKRC